jgi:hypothetical protein
MHVVATPARSGCLLHARVLMRFIQQLHGAMQAARPIHVYVHRRMVVQVFSVIDSGFFDFVDGLIDVVPGFLFFMTQFAMIGALQQRPCGAKIDGETIYFFLAGNFLDLFSTTLLRALFDFKRPISIWPPFAMDSRIRLGCLARTRSYELRNSSSASAWSIAWCDSRAIQEALAK